MKRKFSVITLLIAVLFITSCTPSDSPQYVEATDFRLDTVINIRLYDGTQDQLDHCMDMIKKYDELFSNKNPNSDITKINEASPKPVAVYEDTAEILKKSLEYGRLSEGAFDVTIGAASNLWDFHSEDPEIPTDLEIKDAIKTVDYNQLTVEDNTVTLKQNVTDSSFTTRLDVGGIAKGFITDKIRDYLISEGVSSASISLGGNVYILGKKPAINEDPNKDQLFIVGIQKPFSEDGTAACTLRLHDKSVVTSGIYQRYFKKDGKLYHHILDPKTGYPVENDLYSVTIISDDSTDGDALSTMVFSMGYKKGMDFVESTPEIEAVFITSDGVLHPSSGMEQYGYEEVK